MSKLIRKLQMSRDFLINKREHWFIFRKLFYWPNSPKIGVLKSKVLNEIPTIYAGFISSIYNKDLESLENMCEPLFYIKLCEHLKEIEESKYVLKIQGIDRIGGLNYSY